MNHDAPVQVQGAKEPSSFKLIFSLSFAGLVSGLAIAAAYQLTLPIITANKQKELQEAVFEVLPCGGQAPKMEDEAKEVVPCVDSITPMRRTDKGLESVPEGTKGEDIIYAGFKKDGSFAGYAIPAEGSGFQDAIALIYGYHPAERVIIGLKVLDSRETPGLGDKIMKDHDFLANFQHLSTEPEVIAVKKGAKQAPNEIDAITGATISSKAIVTILNVSQARWRETLNVPPPGKE